MPCLCLRRQERAEVGFCWTALAGPWAPSSLASAPLLSMSPSQLRVVKSKEDFSGRGFAGNPWGWITDGAEGASSLGRGPFACLCLPSLMRWTAAPGQTLGPEQRGRKAWRKALILLACPPHPKDRTPHVMDGAGSTSWRKYIHQTRRPPRAPSPASAGSPSLSLLLQECRHPLSLGMRVCCTVVLKRFQWDDGRANVWSTKSSDAERETYCLWCSSHLTPYSTLPLS